MKSRFLIDEVLYGTNSSLIIDNLDMYLYDEGLVNYISSIRESARDVLRKIRNTRLPRSHIRSFFRELNRRLSKFKRPTAKLIIFTLKAMGKLAKWVSIVSVILVPIGAMTLTAATLFGAVGFLLRLIANEFDFELHIRGLS